MDYDNDPADCMNPLAHSGHGTASGCSSNPQQDAPTNSVLLMTKIIMAFSNISNSNQFNQITIQYVSLCHFITLMITNGKLHHHGTPKKHLTKKMMLNSSKFKS